MKHHVWEKEGPRDDLPGEDWWVCHNCGARDSSICKPWVSRTNDPNDANHWYEDGTAKRVSMLLVTSGWSPGLMDIESDCDLELVSRMTRS